VLRWDEGGHRVHREGIDERLMGLRVVAPIIDEGEVGVFNDLW
jgi:hypothetical protein